MIKLAFYKGSGGTLGQKIFDWLVRHWPPTCGPYAHVEFVDPDSDLGWSSSWRDGGVRSKAIDWASGNWDFLEIEGDPLPVRDWFIRHRGEPYDAFGLLFFVFHTPQTQREAWFCSEAVTAALQQLAEYQRILPAPSRTDPNGLFLDLHAIVTL